MDYNQPQNQSFKVLQIIHGAFCVSVTLFLVITFVLNTNHPHFNIEPKDVPLLYIGVIFAAGIPLLSVSLYQRQMSTIDYAAPVKQKLAQYTTASILRFAPIEGAALFNVVIWFITGNLVSAVAAVVLILYMISLRPVKSKVTSLLQISYPETLD
jgi:hypothetical protein